MQSKKNEDKELNFLKSIQLIEKFFEKIKVMFKKMEENHKNNK